MGTPFVELHARTYTRVRRRNRAEKTRRENVEYKNKSRQSVAYEIAFPAAVINKTELSTDRRYLPDPCFIPPSDRRALFFA